MQQSMEKSQKQSLLKLSLCYLNQGSELILAVGFSKEAIEHLRQASTDAV
jgi:hypothetical protein